jgi:hypothetical protein
MSERRCLTHKSSDSWNARWCEYAEDVNSHSEVWETSHISDFRSVNWLRVCTKTGKVVVWNKKCDQE